MKTIIYGEKIYSARLHFPETPEIPAPPKKAGGVTEIILLAALFALAVVAIYFSYRENPDRQRS